MKKSLPITLSILTILYLLLEVQSVMLAVNSLSTQLTHKDLVRFESIAYATAGLGFALFFTVQGFSFWRTHKKKRFFIIPLILAPVTFILGQLISISIVENIPETLSQKQKGLALKSSMMLSDKKTKTIAPFFLERSMVSSYSSKKAAVNHYKPMTEFEAQLQIVAGVNFISEINLAYKHSQPSEKELRIYRSRILAEFLDNGKYNVFDHDGVNKFISHNPVEINPALDLITDINVLLTQSELNISQRLSLVALHIESKSDQYNRLLLQYDLEKKDANIKSFFKQDGDMDYLERVYMLTEGFGVDGDVAANVAKNSAMYSLRYGMTYKMFNSIIPLKYEVSPLALGLSEKQFLKHKFMEQMIEVNAPLMKFNDVEFIPISKLSEHKYANSINDSVRDGLTDSVLNKVKTINTMIAIEMFEGGFRWDGLWAKNAMMPKLIPAVSMPIIILVSIILILMNIMGTLTLVGVPNKIQYTVVAIFLTLVAMSDLRVLSSLYFDISNGHLDWLLNFLSDIGMKPSAVY
jgi:hypothetical protein